MINLKQYANVKVIGTLVVLAVVIVVWKNGARWWQQIKRRDRGNYEGQEDVEANPARKAQLNALAHAIYVEIQGSPSMDREDIINQLMAVNDTELRYVAEYYTNTLNIGTPLREDLESEWFLGDIGDQVIARLNQLAL